MNMNMMCTRCKKRMAVVYLSYGDKSGQGSQALCLNCAKELNIQPFKDMMDKMGISDEELESMSEQMTEMVQEDPDVVVVGFDTTLTYEKLEKACTYIRNGATFLATHLDINCPTEDGFIPDCGAMCALITKSTGVEPRYLGKPFPETMEMVLKLTGCTRDEIVFVGDRLYTDVATGVKNGAKGFLVLTGEADMKTVEESEVKPTCIYDSLLDISKYL